MRAAAALGALTVTLTSLVGHTHPDDGIWSWIGMAPYKHQAQWIKEAYNDIRKSSDGVCGASLIVPTSRKNGKRYYPLKASVDGCKCCDYLVERGWLLLEYKGAGPSGPIHVCSCGQGVR
jgi:hypothetical protein